MNWKNCITALLDTGLSVDEIATEIGVTGNAVREVVAGRTKQPRANAAIRLMGLAQKRGVRVDGVEHGAMLAPAPTHGNTTDVRGGGNASGGRRG